MFSHEIKLVEFSNRNRVHCVWANRLIEQEKQRVPGETAGERYEHYLYRLCRFYKMRLFNLSCACVSWKGVNKFLPYSCCNTPHSPSINFTNCAYFLYLSFIYLCIWLKAFAHTHTLSVFMHYLWELFKLTYCFMTFVDISYASLMQRIIPGKKYPSLLHSCKFK